MIPGRKNSTIHTWRQRATKDVTGLNGLGMLMAHEQQGTRMQRESHFCSLGAPLCLWTFPVFTGWGDVAV